MNFFSHLQRCCALVLGFWLVISPSAHAQSALHGGSGSLVVTDQVRAELIAHAPDGVGAGRTVWVGLKLTHQAHWHTYWKNSGDSGQPTDMQWNLPTGVQAGDTAWPTPQTLRLGSLVNYGYEDTVVLAAPLRITPEFQASPLSSGVRIGLQARWLVCKTECIPQEGQFELLLPTNSSTALHAVDFQNHQAQLPQAYAGTSRVRIDGNQLQFELEGLPQALHGQQLDLYPETPDVIETSAPWSQRWQDNTWQATVPINRYRSASPTSMPLVVAGQIDGRRQGWLTPATVVGDWPARQPMLGGAAVAAPAAPIAPEGLAASAWLAVVGAFLGGMLLNLMPCVFPVLAIKVLGFTRKPHATHSHRMQGIGYSLGVVLSFMALGGAMLALRSAGAQLGWGFQLQSPAVVAGLAVLFTLIGLNLAGVFEFGHLLPSRVATLESKNPVINAFLSGVLAVLIASPCTAPFMGASLGLALSLPAWEAMLIFSSLGLGMALPYLAASWSPRLAETLPRPGAWMNIFRHGMAFPMFGTVIWLLWVLGQQSGINGAAALMSLLVVLAMLVWALHLRGRARMPLSLVSALLLLFLSMTLGPYVVRQSESSASVSNAARWQSWSAGKVESLLANQQAVFVDFTAAWCVTCQVNKMTTLSDSAVLADFDARQVTLLRADWTRQDPAITEALRALGRNGVPVYALYAPGKPVQVLSEILTAAEVRAALAKL